MLGKGKGFSRFPFNASLPKQEKAKMIKEMHMTMKILSLLALVACLALVGCDKSSTTTTTPSTNMPASTNK
jgi:uncharacterized lipoprotein YajG